MAQKCSKIDAHNVHASLQSALAQFQEQLAPGIGRLIAGQVSLPPWKHNSTLLHDENLLFLRSLNLPASSRSTPDYPSLLLHDLGCLGGDPDYMSYIAQIFRPGTHTLLVNTSGAGKTRILLEGMCQHWGFYFTTEETFGISQSPLGSSDLADTIYSRLPQSPGFTEDLSRRVQGRALHDSELKDRLVQNCAISRRLFQAVLLARLVLFEQYLAIMKYQGLRATNDLKKRWLLLQIDPLLLNMGDVFYSLVDVINSQHVNDVQLQEFIAIYWCRIRFTLNVVSGSSSYGHDGDPSHVYLVIDEAQHAVQKFPDAFRSHYTNIKNADPRPVLRELVFCWFNTIMHLIRHPHMCGSVPACTFVITGTGISRDMMRDALSSSFFKKQPLRIAHTTGGLDTPEAQLKYIRRYLPERFLASRQGQALVQRLWYWLSGRFRFTAEYIALLIQHGLQRPHRLLNVYIEYFTGIKATDNKTFVRNEPEFSVYPDVDYDRLRYEKLRDRPNMMKTIKNLVYNYLRRSLLPDSAQTLGDDKSLLVQHGFARFRAKSASNNRAEVCEPLILLGTALWLDANHESLYSNLCDELGTDSTSKNGFEDYLVYFFIRAFERPQGTPLGEVFQFSARYSSTLGQIRATLVAVHRSEIDDTIVDYSETTFRGGEVSLSGCLGENAKSPEQLEDWVELKKHTAFSFPPLAMGPDILFVLKLHAPGHPRYIWVAVQAKFILGGSTPLEFISKPDLIRAIRTVTPSRFYLSKSDSNPPTPEELEGGKGDRISAVLEALDNLPHREPSLFGQHSVLRVIAVFPPEANLAEADFIADPDDTEGHPLVSLKHDYLVSCISEEHPTNKLKNVKVRHFEKIKDEKAEKEKSVHHMRRKKMEKLKRLTLPLEYNSKSISAMKESEMNDYLECFRMLLGARVPQKSEGARRTREGKVTLLQRLLSEHYESGGSSSVAEILATRSKNIRRFSREPSAGASSNSRGRSKSVFSMDIDSDAHMND